MTDSPQARPWRCFVAVPLPDELRAALATWLASARGANDLDADWRWADPAGWHITLAFLGATPSHDVPVLLGRLADGLAGLDAFSVAGGGLGAFPNRAHARVLWYGIKDADHRLADLAAIVRAATGTEDEARFRAHVTLARARERQGVAVPSLPVDSLPTFEVPVAGVSLMRSHTGHGPARYESLGDVALLPALVASRA